MVDDLGGVRMPPVGGGRDQLEALESLPEGALRCHPGMGAHGDRLEPLGPEQRRQENGRRVVAAERELARVIVGREHAQHVLVVVAAAHHLRHRRPRGVRVREMGREPHPGRRQRIQVRARRIGASPGAQPIRPRGVEQDEDDRGRGGMDRSAGQTGEDHREGPEARSAATGTGFLRLEEPRTKVNITVLIRRWFQGCGTGAPGIAAPPPTWTSQRRPGSWSRGSSARSPRATPSGSPGRPRAPCRARPRARGAERWRAGPGS